MSFYSVANSTPNFVINNAAAASQARNNIVAPWAAVAHLPKTVNIGNQSITLTPEQTASGVLYCSTGSTYGVVQNVTLPDAASWYRFLSTRSIPGYENISDNDMLNIQLLYGGSGAVNILPGTGASAGTHSYGKVAAGKGATGVQSDSIPIQWRVTSTGTWYNIL